MNDETLEAMFQLSGTIGRVTSALTDGSAPERRKELAEQLAVEWKALVRELV
jgi:hypothetical protein